MSLFCSRLFVGSIGSCSFISLMVCFFFLCLCMSSISTLFFRHSAIGGLFLGGCKYFIFLNRHNGMIAISFRIFYIGSSKCLGCYVITNNNTNSCSVLMGFGGLNICLCGNNLCGVCKFNDTLGERTDVFIFFKVLIEDICDTFICSINYAKFISTFNSSVNRDVFAIIDSLGCLSGCRFNCFADSFGCFIDSFSCFACMLIFKSLSYCINGFGSLLRLLIFRRACNKSTVCNLCFIKSINIGINTSTVHYCKHRCLFLSSSGLFNLRDRSSFFSFSSLVNTAGERTYCLFLACSSDNCADSSLCIFCSLRSCFDNLLGIGKLGNTLGERTCGLNINNCGGCIKDSFLCSFRSYFSCLNNLCGVCKLRNTLGKRTFFNSFTNGRLLCTGKKNSMLCKNRRRNANHRLLSIILDLSRSCFGNLVC